MKLRDPLLLADGTLHPALQKAYYLFSVANTVRPSVDAGEMITPAQEFGTPVTQGLGLIPLIRDCSVTVTNKHLTTYSVNIWLGYYCKKQAYQAFALCAFDEVN